MKVGFLSIGEGGSNVGEYAAQKGFSVVTVNSAQVDLDKLKIIPKELRIHLSGWEGAGRNREIGKEAMITHSDKVFEIVNSKFEDFDMVFAVGSSAGGTGSGGLPIGIEILSGLECNVGAMTILPEVGESPKANMNALECFSELSKFENLGSIIVIDNEKAKKVFENKDKSKIYEESNKQFIDNLQDVITLTRKSSYTSNFDKNDLLEIIGERGCTIIAKATIPIEEIKDSQAIADSIKDSWNKVCSPDLWKGQIVKAAILGRVPKEMTTMVDSNLIFKDTGTPYEIFEAYYSNEECKNHCIFYTVLSGLVFPTERLNEIEKGIQLIEESLLEKVEVARNQTFETTNWNTKFKRTPKKKETKSTLSERLAKFQ